MIRDLKYPEDARRVIDALHKGLGYDAAVAVLGNACSKLRVEGDTPDFSTPIRVGGREEDEAVRRDSVGLLSRFSLILMVSRFEGHLKLLLLQRRVLEELRASGKKMEPGAMWRILRQVYRESRKGPVKMCSELVVEAPSNQLATRMRWLSGIYRVRNCLAHRLGSVQIEDIRTPGTPLEQLKDEDKLRVVWLRVKASSDGKELTKFPTRLSGSELKVSFEESERSWKIGDQIELDPADCQCIALSLSLLGNQVLADFEREMNAILGQANAASP